MVDFINKRLQVFMSSTFTDLIPERQAAVEAILTAGHIPAGMELFTAGNESQMDVIKQWIDESDVYMLILGGRYGSVEPKTKKSYTHLEFEYAVKKKKPLFSCVITEDEIEIRVRNKGSSIIERECHNELVDFRKIVLGRMVKFFDSPKDIKIIVSETLSHFSRRDDLSGWIRPNRVANVAALADEIARLSKENSDLRSKFNTQVISSRADLYRFCAKIISDSNQIRDTSWGRYPYPLDEIDLEAREEYRNAVYCAINDGKVYKELFSKSEYRTSLISDAQEKKKINEHYEARLLDIDLSQFSLLDFMIVDNSDVILSHVDARHEVPTFLHIKSTEIAQLFLRLFQESWVQSVDITDNSMT